MELPSSPAPIPAGDSSHRASQRMPMIGVRDDRTAVVVVHGVGSPDPGVTSAAFAAAMVNAMRERGAPTPMFERTNFSLPLNGIAAPPSPDGALPAEDILLRRQLDDYAGAEPDETLAVAAHAIRSGRSDMPPIDVYGAWWGDIGSFGEGPLRAALYVLRFISRFFSLGLTSVEAAADTTGTRFWYQTEWWHKTFARLVFGVIPTVLLLNALVFVAIAFRDVSMGTALRVSLAIGAVVAAVGMLPRILRSGNSGPIDWFARPAIYATLAIFLIGLADTNREYAPGMPFWRWFTPLHLLGIIWLLIGIAGSLVTRSLVSVGQPAPRWPRTAPPVPPAERLAARRTPRARFVNLAWPVIVALTVALPASDGIGKAAAAFSVTFLIAILTSPLNVLVLGAWLLRRKSGTGVSGQAIKAWGRRAGMGVGAAIALGVLGETVSWLLLSGVAAAVLVADVAAFYRGRPFRGHALPGIGGAVLILLPAIAVAMISRESESQFVLAAGTGVLSMAVLELFARLDAWWSQPQASPAFTNASTVGRARRARLWLAEHHAQVAVGLAVLYAAWSFVATATTPPTAVELGGPGGETIAASTAAYAQHGADVLRQSVVNGFGSLRTILTGALLYSWIGAYTIVVLALIVALYVTLRGFGRWNENRYLASTTWTSVVTASGTMVSVLLVQAFAIQFAIGDTAEHPAPPNPALIAAEQAVTGGSVAVATAEPEHGGWRQRFWQRVDGATTMEIVEVKAVLFRLHEWAGVQMLALAAFALVMGAAAAWTLFPALRSDTNPRAKPWSSPVQLGRWATTGSEVLAVAMALGIPALAIMPAAASLLYPGMDELAHNVNATLFTAFFGAGTVVALSQIGAIITVLRPALALAADIEIYLRVAPYDRTPRARLMDRMTSLLTHLENTGYTRIVVIAHSQGSVIAADALRLRGRLIAQGASVGNAPTAKRPRVSLITIGSPLQNLYARAFPYLFSWVQDTDTDADDGTVNARRAGVDQWINLYRSGDYIGRYLWFSGSDDERFADQSATVKARSAAGESFDACIGYGGHTGYWSHPAVIDAVTAQATVDPRV